MDRNSTYDSSSLSTRGGVCLLVPDTLCVTRVRGFSSGMNDNLNIEIEQLDTIIICIYRTPNSSKHHFSLNLKHIEEYISSSKLGKVIVNGDMNFSKNLVTWSGLMVDETEEFIPTVLGYFENDTSNIQSDKKKQAQNFINCMSLVDDISQLVTKITNGINILDLIYTNLHPVTNVEHIESYPFSDHNILRVKLEITPTLKWVKTAKTQEPLDLRICDYNTTFVDWEAVSVQLSGLDWIKTFEGQNSADQLTCLFNIVKKILIENGAKRKRVGGKKRRNESKESKESRRIKHRITYLKRKLEKERLSPKLRVDTLFELSNLNIAMREELKNKLLKEEIKASDKITKDSSYFYKYVNSFKKQKKQVGPILDENGKLTRNNKTMSNIFNNYFSTVYDRFNPTSDDEIIKKFT